MQRPIFHPSFRNVSVADAVELLDKDDTQTWLLRPSPRGPGQIVLTMQVGIVTSCLRYQQDLLADRAEKRCMQCAWLLQPMSSGAQARMCSRM